MDERPRPSRRTLLAAIGGSAAPGIAGCGFGGDGDGVETITTPACEGEVSLSVSPPSDGEREQWPLSFYDGERTGYAPNTAPETLEDDWSVTARELAEHVDGLALGGPELVGGWAPPVVFDGTLLVPSRAALHAVDGATGDHRWAVETPMAWGLPPFTFGEVVVVVVGSDDPGSDPTRLIGIDRTAGTIRWEYPIQKPEQFHLPVVADATLLHVRPDSITPLDPQTGDPRADAFSPPDDLTADDSAADDETLYIRSGTTVAAMDPTDGTERWRRTVDVSLPDDVEGRPGLSLAAVGARHLYLHQEYTPPQPDGSDGDATTRGRLTGTAGASEAVVALDASSGERVWTYPVAQSLLSDITGYADGTLFVAGERDPRLREAANATGFVEAVDAANGCRLWSVEPFSGSNFPEVGVTGADGTLFVGTATQDIQSAALYALDATDGTVLDTYQYSNVETASAPSIVNGRAYVGIRDEDNDTSIRAFGDGGG